MPDDEILNEDDLEKTTSLDALADEELAQDDPLADDDDLVVASDDDDDEEIELPETD